MVCSRYIFRSYVRHVAYFNRMVVMSEKNYIIRRDELRKKIRRDFHRPTRSERNPKTYIRREKHRTFYIDSAVE